MRDHLLEEFLGRTLTFKQLVDEEARRTQYTEANYREAVLLLEASFESLWTRPPRNDGGRVERSGRCRKAPN
jgi:hypothetical protein